MENSEEVMAFWKEHSYISLPMIYDISKSKSLEGTLSSNLLNIFKAFNSSDFSIDAITKVASSDDFSIMALQQYIDDNALDQFPFEKISGDLFKKLRNKLFEAPEEFMLVDLKDSFYPYYSPGRTYGYKSEWVKGVTKKSSDLFKIFSQTRRSDTAILVGNGPSLNKIDFDLFRGQDVYVSNYAMKNNIIAQHARGVAVTNHLVAEQEPYWFSLNSIWKFHPLWLAYTLPQTETSILLNALGGKLFFSEDVTSKIAWHSTVTFFWLQILYSAGYGKVVMTGFDHFYHQEATAKEGDLIKQTTNDENHFDPNYFKGKNWQAADVSKMEETYVLAKAHYEKDGREIINATVGGHLEVFRRSELSKEISKPRLYGRIARPNIKPKIAIISAFWKGDISHAELHWRLINRLGVPSVDHIYLFKHNSELLQSNTLPRVVCADIENVYPQASQMPHPAGPNLVFVHTVKMLLDTQYTHFFWLEPDCIPTDKDWLNPFISRLEQYPDEPIIGTGGGTVTPGKLHWRNHFAGCSLYSLKHLAEVDWEGFISNQLDISFDVWLAVNLGYIKLEKINNADQSETIIYGKNRYDWSVLRTPKSLVYGMFEHWRPEKIMTLQQLEERLSWPGFSLYHAIKDMDIIRNLYKLLPKSATTIIINYNNENFLRDAIQSALDQKIDNIQYEVIVVDDGSTDTSKTIIQSFNNKIKTIILDHGIMNGNFNQQRALKAGLEVASGEVILLLDGDDIFYEGKVQRICAMFDDHEVVLGQHTLNLIDENGMPLNKTFEAFPSESIKPAIYQKLGKVNLYQATSGLAFRRSYLVSQLHHLCVDDHINTWLDVRLTRFAPYFGKVYSSRDKLGAWRRHSNSDSIRTDNIVYRIQGHELWFDAASKKEGFPSIPFKWKNEKKIMSINTLNTTPILGPFTRDHKAHWDETLGIRQFTYSNKYGQMIDVGAHEGYALMPFLNDGWSIIAFEPDNKNRRKLLARLAEHKNKALVSLDTRCVSNKPQKGISFYNSEQSTGISGLSAFHETHVEAQKVDITTLTEFFHNKPLPTIDFLKIDTEGHDLFVLQGFPWDQGKPIIIECEFEDTKTVPLGYTFHDLAEFLVKKGYTVYVSEWHPIIRYGIQHDWNQLMRYPCELADLKGWGNLLAFRDPIDENELVTAVKKVLKIGSVPSSTNRSIALSNGFRVETRPCFEMVDFNQWRYTHSSEQQTIWIAFKEDISTKYWSSFVGSMCLIANQEMVVNVSIGRYRNTDYEGETKRVKLLPSVKQEIKIYNKFKKLHTSLKLQVEVLEIKGANTALLTIDKLNITEYLSINQDVMYEKNICLSEANRLFRDKEYLNSMEMYLFLYKQRPLQMYLENALMSARKIGMSSITKAEDLLQLLEQ